MECRYENKGCVMNGRIYVPKHEQSAGKPHERERAWLQILV